MRICIADSDSKTRLFLASLGHEVMFASCKDGLLSAVENCPVFDAVIIDAKTVSSDLTLLRRIHDVRSSTTIIVMFGPDEDQIPEGMFWGKAHAFLRKPKHLGKLKMILSRLSEYRTDRNSESEITRKFRVTKLVN